MPNFYGEGYNKVSLARSNASLYGNKEELYDRLRRHAYNGKKGMPKLIKHLFFIVLLSQKRE